MFECEACNAKFSLGQDYIDGITTPRCPDCGASSYRQLPTPLESDMAIRDMPAPGELDMGGNPLQEGIMGQIDGGWKGRKNRDESFASVKALEHLAGGYDQWLEEPYQRGEDGDAQCPECQVHPLEDQGDGTGVCHGCGYVERDYDTYKYEQRYAASSPQQAQYEQTIQRLRSTPGLTLDQLLDGPWKGEKLDPKVYAIIKQQEATGGDADVEGLWPPTPADSPVRDFKVKDMHEQVHHQRQRLDTGHQLNWQQGQMGRGLVVDAGSGPVVHTWPFNPETNEHLNHAEYMEKLGLDPMDPHTQSQVSQIFMRPDGSIDEEASVLHNHHYDALAQQGIKPQPTGEFDFFSRMKPSEDQFIFLAETAMDFETTDVIPPGPHSTEVVPFMSPGKPGWHAGTVRPLSHLGVTINGEPASPKFHRQTGSFTISHEDPKILETAKKIAETGNVWHPEVEGPYTEALCPHQAQISAPNGVTEDLHQALGAFNVAVEHPERGHLAPYRTHHQTVRANHPGGPLRIGTGDPELTRLVSEFSQTGDKGPLMQYQQQRTAGLFGIDSPDFVDDIGNAVDDGTGAVMDAGQGIGLVPENFSLGELAGTAAWLIPGGMAVRGAMGAGKLAAGAMAKAAPGAGAAAMGTAVPAAGAAAAKAPGLLGRAKSLANNPMVKGYMMGNAAENALGDVTQTAMTPPAPNPYVIRPTQQLSHLEVLAGGWHPSSDPTMHHDQKELKDGDKSGIWDQLDLSAGGTDSVHGLDDHKVDTDVDPEFEKHFPKLFLYNLSEEDSALEDDDPEFVKFVKDLSEQEVDGDEHINIEELIDEFEQHLNTIEKEAVGGPSHEQQKNQWANSDDGKVSSLYCPNCGGNDVEELGGSGHALCRQCGHDFAISTGKSGEAPIPSHIVDMLRQSNVPNLPGAANGHVPTAPQAPAAPQAPNAIPGENTCPRCAAPMSPEATSCPACGSGTGTQQVMPQAVTPQPQQSTPPMMAPLNPQARTAGLQCPSCKATDGQPPYREVHCDRCGMAQEPYDDGDYRNIKCRSCGAESGPGPHKEGTCDRCSMHGLSKAAGGHMGPKNNEQFAAVAELLQLQGREAEIPEMLAEPWNYAEELAEAQSKQIQPPIDETLTDAPPDPAQEVAPPGTVTSTVAVAEFALHTRP